MRKKIERMRRCRRGGGVVVVGSEIGGGWKGVEVGVDRVRGDCRYCNHSGQSLLGTSLLNAECNGSYNYRMGTVTNSIRCT